MCSCLLWGLSVFSLLFSRWTAARIRSGDWGLCQLRIFHLFILQRSGCFWSMSGWVLKCCQIEWHWMHLSQCEQRIVFFFEPRSYFHLFTSQTSTARYKWQLWCLRKLGNTSELLREMHEILWGHLGSIETFICQVSNYFWITEMGNDFSTVFSIRSVNVNRNSVFWKPRLTCSDVMFCLTNSSKFKIILNY